MKNKYWDKNLRRVVYIDNSYSGMFSLKDGRNVAGINSPYADINISKYKK